MNPSKWEYHKFAKLMKYILAIDFLAFLTLLTSSAVAVKNVKHVTAAIILIISAGALVLLYLSRELLNKRSFWMTVSAVMIALCAVCSLILRYPSPNPLDQVNPYTTIEKTVSTEFSVAGWITEASEGSESNFNSSQGSYNTPETDDLDNSTQ